MKTVVRRRKSSTRGEDYGHEKVNDMMEIGEEEKYNRRRMGQTRHVEEDS